MELAKIRNLSDEEIKHQERTSSEQLFRLRFQVAMGQNYGVKKLRQLKKEIAQIKTVARERELGIHGEVKDANAPKAEPAAPVAEAKAAPEAKPKARKTAKKAAPDAETKKEKAKGARK